MALPEWRLVWCDYTTAEVGEIRAQDRTLNFRLNQANTIDFKVELDTDIGKAIAGATYGAGYVKAYRNNTLMMVAEATSIQAIGEPGNRSVAVVAVETAYPILGSVVLAYNEPVAIPTASTQGGAVAMAQAIASRPYCFTSGSSGTTTAVDRSLWDVGTTLLNLFEGLAFRASGFDFWFEPTEPVRTLSGGGYYVNAATIRTAALKGSTKPEAVFEYGIGRRNTDKYTLTATGGDHLCTRSFVRGTSVGNNTQSATATDAAGFAVFGYRDRFFAPDLSDPTLVQDAADMYVSKRGFPRIVFGFDPAPQDGTGRVPDFVTDYVVGDIVTGRVFDGATELLDAEVRIYGVEAKIDDNGLEKITLTLTPDTSA